MDEWWLSGNFDELRQEGRMVQIPF